MIKKIGHISLIFVLVLSTIGYSVDMHFCMDHLVDFSIFSEAGDCCDKEMPMQDGCANNDHCNDEVLSIATLSDYVVSSFNLNFDEQEPVQIIDYPSEFLNPSEFDNLILVRSGKSDNSFSGPPDILSFIQTYLI